MGNMVTQTSSQQPSSYPSHPSHPKIDLHSTCYKTKDEICVPEKYKQQFLHLLDEMEKETGNIYSLEILRLGCYQKLRFGAFENRENLIVYDASPGHELIEGKYKTVSDIRKKICELLALELNVINGIWKCDTCQYENPFSYGEHHFRYATCCEGKCRNFRTTRWDQAEVNVLGLNIGFGDQEKTPIAKLKFQNN